MGKKGKKTRWRRLPIGGGEEEGGISLEAPPPTTDAHRITFNEDEYTKITTPRQDVLFKKGYLGRKRPPNPSPSDSQETQSASADSVESESYVSEEAQYFTPNPPGFVDQNGVYYVNGNMYETYDPYTNTVTVVVGPGAQYPGAPVLAALPCHSVPLQPVEWFNPPQPAPWCSSYNRKKRYSTDSQNCSAQSSESTGPPGSPQEPVDEGACAIYPPQYVYPGYMFGPPIYNMNGMTVQGMVPQPVPVTIDPSVSKRRKKRRRKRRGGVTDDGSESSCCDEVLQCQSEMSSDAACHSGASSDAGVANSDSGINTDPTPNSGSNSPPLTLSIAQASESVELPNSDSHCDQGDQSNISCDPHQSKVYLLSSNDKLVISSANEENDDSAIHVITRVVEERSADEAVELEEVFDSLSAAEDDLTPNLCANAPEFSSQESTLSCLSTSSTTKELIPEPNERLVSESHESEISKLHEIAILESPKNTVLVSRECAVLECAVSESHENSVSKWHEIAVSKSNEIAIFESPESAVLECAVSNSITSQEEEFVNCQKTQREIVDSTAINSAKPSESNEDALQTSVVLSVEIENVIVPEEDNTDKSVTACETVVDEIERLIEETEIEQIPKVPEVQTTPLHIEPNKSETLSFSVVQFGADEEKVSFHQEDIDDSVEDVIPRPEFTTESCLDLESSSSSQKEQICTRFPPCTETIAPVPPPRRKRSMCRAADKLASKIVDDAIREGIEEAVHIQTRSPLTITEAVTRWLHSHGSSPLTCPLSDSDEEDEKEEESTTGQKNVYGNPFPASYRSERVAKDSESVESTMSAGEWDLWDSRTRDMCDPARSVDKYYRLGADDGAGDLPPSIYKTAMHIRHTGPFPCGVCCIIQ